MTQCWRVLLAVVAGLCLSSRAFAEPVTWEAGEPPVDGEPSADVEEPHPDAAYETEPDEQGVGDSTADPLEDGRVDESQGKHYGEAQSYELQGQYEEAIKAYRRASKGNRRQPEVLSRIAFCYVMLQDYPNAISHYREALRLQPRLVEERFRLGEAYLKSGQRELAMTQYRKLMQVDQQKAAELKQLIEPQSGAASNGTEAEPTPAGSGLVDMDPTVAAEMQRLIDVQGESVPDQFESTPEEPSEVP